MILLVKDHACIREKGIVLCQNKGEHVCKFYGRPFEEEEDDDDEEIVGLAIFHASL